MAGRSTWRRCSRGRSAPSSTAAAAMAPRSSTPTTPSHTGLHRSSSSCADDEPGLLHRSAARFRGTDATSIPGSSPPRARRRSTCCTSPGAGRSSTIRPGIPAARPGAMLKDTMKLLKASIRPDKVDEVSDALEKLKVSGMTVTEVRGHGTQKGHTAVYRGKEYDVSVLPKVRSKWSSPTSRRRRDPGDGRGRAHRRNRRRPRLRAAGRTRLPHPHRASATVCAAIDNNVVNAAEKCHSGAAARRTGRRAKTDKNVHRPAPPPQAWRSSRSADVHVPPSGRIDHFDTSAPVSIGFPD